MPSDSPSSPIPAIQTFQFDANSVGDLQSSVNLFRGDINFTQTLLSMPGRQANDGLDLTVSLLYQSNVYDDATTWNRDAPTSVLGLGWSMPAATIVLNDTGSLMPANRQYSYASQSISTDLAREPTNPYLFTMDSSLAGQLSDGAAVPSAVVSAFGAVGLYLSASALVSATGSSQWQLADDVNQQLFSLCLEGDNLTVLDGGESYQLVDYAFWKILYYPCYERWLVFTENGLKMSFGGRSSDTSQGYSTAIGNSIEWGVRWAASGGTAALWQGDSALTDGQTQYARAWHLCQTANAWGDVVSYSYNNWPRLPSGLIPYVEQSVGQDGLPYTKACYLTGMTDVFGRQVQLQYEEKQWSNAAPESPREYADPHKSVPNTDANAYQDCYETLYLQGLTVVDTGGSTLFSFTFSYSPSNPAGGAGSPVANVTSSTGALFGDTCKRFLTGITLDNAAGASLPGLVFDYYFDATQPGASPGALKSITYSQGATATYSYTQQSLDICDRSLAVSPPSTFAGATPRVFFGDGYAVVTWYAPANGALSLQVYTWLGNWRSWQPTSDSIIYSNSAGLDLATLNVIAREAFFALSFAPGDGSDTTIYVFQKDYARPTQWTAATIEGTQSGLNTPNLTYSTASGQVVITGGSTFLVAVSTNLVAATASCDRITWRWTEQAWTRESFSSLQLSAVAACNEYYLLLDLNGNAALFALDACLNWNAAAALQIPGFSAVNVTSLTLTPSDSFVVVSNVTGPGPTTVSYCVTIVQWDELYCPVSPPPSYSYRDVMDINYPIDTVANVSGNSCIAVAGHVLRFSGTTWLRNDSLSVPYAPSGEEQRYAYGPDYATQILAYPNGGGDTTALVLSFDPDSDFETWSRLPVTPAQSLPIPGSFAATANWPSAGGTDWMSLGQYLYFRDTACNWDGVVQVDASADMQALANQALGGNGQYILNTEAVIDQAPDFLAYFVSDSATTSDDQVTVTLLLNGQVSMKTQPFAQQRIYTAEEGHCDPGTYPGGSGMFVAYPSADGDFDNASCIILHSYAGDQVDGKLEHYAVTGLSIDNGLGQINASSFVPDPGSAACDPTGKVFKYYESAVYPGTSDPSQPVFGWTIKRYLNGLKVLDGADFYNMLDGQLYQAETYDAGGTMLAQSTTSWKVYVTRATSATDPSAPILNLKGGFLFKTGQSRVEDGVASSIEFSCVNDGFAAPFSGQIVSTTKATYGGIGQLETFRSDTLYAYEMDDTAIQSAMLAQHRLADTAQAVTYWQRGGSEPVAAKATARTFASFPSAYGSAVLVPGESGSFTRDGTGAVPFPFADYQQGIAPQGWTATKYTLAYSPFGQIAEAQEPTGVSHSVVYGTGSTFAVARFTNASVAANQCAYYGFEAYETASGWNVSGSQLVVGDAHTGTTSLGLGANGQGSLSVQTTPPNVDSVYLLGFWYKTPPGFTITDGAGFSATLTVDGTIGSPLIAAFADTGGTWLYQTLGIPITAGANNVVLDVIATNASSDVVLIDDVFVTPLVSKLTVQVYDQSYQLVTATLDSAGTTCRRLYDAFQRLTATVGTDEAVKALSVGFLSREGNTSGAFDAAAPNADISISPASGGVAETFLNGEEWQQRWAASNYPDNWQRTNGSLRHVGPTVDSLAWQGGSAGNGAGATSTAFYVELTPDDQLAGPVSIIFGSGYAIAFDPSAGFSFTDPDGNIVQAALGAPPDLPAQWLLILDAQNVLFFGDGQLLFSAQLAFGDPTIVSLSTGPNPIMLTNLAMLANPRLSIAFRDGSGQECQTQQWLGNDALIYAVIRDAIGRTVAVTRHAPASFGSGQSLPLLTYHETFVDVGAFLASMDDSWIMTGDVADYYAGQSDGPVTRSDDQGYPYYGYRFEASPRRRRIEQGIPGKQYAVCDIQETTPATRQTTQFAFAANVDGTFGLPENYVTQTTTDPVKNQLLQLRDTMGRDVAASIGDQTGEVSGQSLVSIGFSDSSSTTAIDEPNSFTASPQSDPTGYVSNIERDGAGRTSETADANTGSTAFIYDTADRLRFTQPALDSGDLGFIYNRYDALGRIVEEGIVVQAWDVATLQEQANDPTWPNDEVSRTVVRSYCYDGDGSDPTKIGRKTAAVTINQVPSNISGALPVQVTETFIYDGCGRVTDVTLVLDGQVSATGTIGYTYNNLDQLVQTSYPASSPLENVLYTYDALGRVIGIGTSVSTPTDIASYTYTPDGAVETESRNNGTLNGAFGYASPGWLTSQTITVSGLRSASFALGYDYLANGYPQSRTLSVAFDTLETSHTIFTYDAQGRLLTALVDGTSAGSEQIDQYDANGNIWSLIEDGNVAYDFANTDGSDQLSMLKVGDNAESVFTYNARGNLVNSGDLALAYDPALNLVQGIAAADDSFTLRFAYNSLGQRTLNVASTADQPDITFSGLSQNPLLIQRGGIWSALVYGPTGLVAAISDQTYFPVKDAMHTVVATLDSQNRLVGQFAYRAFGSIFSSSGSNQAAVPFRFMGREYDDQADLYNFGARLYSPRLRRFLAADPARDVASPYVFVANNPLIYSDPTGNKVTVGEQIGIGVGMGLLAIGGFFLSLFSFGTAAPAVVEAEADLGLAEGTLEAGANVGEETSNVVASAARQTLSDSFFKLTVATRTQAVLATLFTQTSTNTVFGIGASGLQYDCRKGSEFTRKGFGQALLTGAASGALFGALSGAYNTFDIFWDLGKVIPNALIRIPARFAINIAEGIVSNDVTQIAANAVQHQPWSQGVARATWIGAVSGVPFGLGDVISNEAKLIKTGALVQKADQAFGAAVKDASSTREATLSPSLNRSYGTINPVPGTS